MDQIVQGLTGSIMTGVYLANQIPVAMAAYLWAKRFRPANGFELLTVAGILYLLLTVAVTGALGLAGFLSPGTLFVVAWCLAGVAIVTERERPPLRLPHRKWSWPELGLLAMAGGLAFYQYTVFQLLPPVGSDALIYHLYYPALWLTQGSVERVTQPGLMTSSYPCYGELVYAWQMGGTTGDCFAKNFQFFFLLIGCCACVAGLPAAGFRRIEALAAAALLGCSGVIFRNAAVSNTDLMVGAGILAGSALLLCGTRRKRHAMLILGGICFGFAAGTKYLGLLLAPVALLFFGGALWYWKPECRRVLVCAAVAGFLTAIPCFIANWVATGNPFYPVPVGFGASMTPDAPPVGLHLAAWHFFVNEGKNNLSIGNAVILLTALFWAGIAPWLRRGRPATAVLAVGTVLLLLIELRFYPSMTQPRQIIPVAMLAAGCGAAGFRTLRKPWLIFATALVLCYLSSFGHLDFRMHGVEILCWGAATAAFFLISDRISRKWCRWSFYIAVLAAFAFYSGSQFAAANGIASYMRGKLISQEDEICRTLLRERTPQGAAIAYNGAYYYQFLGDNWQNRVLSIPISASGKVDNHDYPDWNAMRTPGAYETYRDRLRANNVAFLICDTRTFAAPEPEIEVKWALAHPEDFEVVLNRNGFYCFAFRGMRR